MGATETISATFDIGALAAQAVHVMFDGGAGREASVDRSSPQWPHVERILGHATASTRSLQQQLHDIGSSVDLPPLERTLAADFARYKQLHMIPEADHRQPAVASNQ